jgi:hypothetical protein
VHGPWSAPAVSNGPATPPQYGPPSPG